MNFEQSVEFLRILLIGYLVDGSKQAWEVTSYTEHMDFLFYCRNLKTNININTRTFDFRENPKYSPGQMRNESVQVLDLHRRSESREKTFEEMKEIKNDNK